MVGEHTGVTLDFSPAENDVVYLLGTSEQKAEAQTVRSSDFLENEYYNINIAESIKGCE